MIKYFIHYTFTNHIGQSGDGNLEVTVDTKIDSMADIKVLEQSIKDELKFTHAVITNYILLR